MILLPSQVAAIEKAASKDAVRYGLQGVRLRDLGEGKFEVVATDGKRLVRLTGEQPTDDFPEVKGFDPRPEGAVREVLLPAGTLGMAAKACPKRSDNPLLRNVAVTMKREKDGQVWATLATTDLERAQVTPVRQVEGRFPEVEHLYWADDPVYTVFVDARLLADTLSVIADLAESGRRGFAAVRIDFHSNPRSAFQISAKFEALSVSALQMPLDVAGFDRVHAPNGASDAPGSGPQDSEVAEPEAGQACEPEEADSTVIGEGVAAKAHESPEPVPTASEMAESEEASESPLPPQVEPASEPAADPVRGYLSRRGFGTFPTAAA